MTKIITEYLNITDPDFANFVEIAIAGAGVIIFLMVAYFVLKKVRTKFHPKEQSKTEDAGCFSMESLDEMFERGMISKEEYSKTRKILLGIPIDKPKAQTPEDSAPDADAPKANHPGEADSAEDDRE